MKKSDVTFLAGLVILFIVVYTCGSLFLKGTTDGKLDFAGSLTGVLGAYGVMRYEIYNSKKNLDFDIVLGIDNEFNLLKENILFLFFNHMVNTSDQLSGERYVLRYELAGILYSNMDSLKEFNQHIDKIANNSKHLIVEKDLYKCSIELQKMWKELYIMAGHSTMTNGEYIVTYHHYPELNDELFKKRGHAYNEALENFEKELNKYWQNR